MRSTRETLADGQPPRMQYDGLMLRYHIAFYLPRAAGEMVVAVREVLRGKTYISQGLSRDAIDCLRWQHKKLVNESERLTDRQREVLQLLAEGKVMKEVGAILNMATRTVAYHKYRMMEVLGFKSNAELVKYAVRNHVIAA